MSESMSDSTSAQAHDQRNAEFRRSIHAPNKTHLEQILKQMEVDEPRQVTTLELEARLKLIQLSEGQSDYTNHVESLIKRSKNLTSDDRQDRILVQGYMAH
jgi:hypothetical protein